MQKVIRGLNADLFFNPVEILLFTTIKFKVRVYIKQTSYAANSKRILYEIYLEHFNNYVTQVAA